jgi:hypothetical protein
MTIISPALAKIKRNPLSAALWLAAQGRRVLAVNPASKRPIHKNWPELATTETDALESWFSPGKLVPAVLTGHPGGVVVLDVEADGLDWLDENHHRLPVTEQYASRSGGRHLVFRHREGIRTLPLGRIAARVELRSTGASAIFWPAIGLPSGCDAPPAELPSWLMPPPKPAWKPPETPWQGDDRRARAYAAAALKSAVQRVAAAGQGCRNAELNRAAYPLRRFIQEGALTSAETAYALAAAAAVAGLDQRETAATLRSALGWRA